MRALIIEHDAISLPGLVGDALSRRGFELDEFVVVTDPERDPGADGVEFPDVAGYDCVVPMGSPWSVYDPKVRSWVDKEIALLRAADRHGIPVLGICFGGQLLAKAHGGTVSRGHTAEYGWLPVSVRDSSPLEPGPWFQWHADRWTTPHGATELAISGAAPQAFTLRRNLAVQFHPEITPEILGLWLEKDQPPGQDPEQLITQTETHTADAEKRVERLVQAFFARVANHPAPG